MTTSNGNLNAMTPETAAAMLQRAGFSFVPAKIDGTKAPSIDSWKDYQSRKPTPKEVEGWYGGGKTRGIAVLMGEISGNAETIDFDLEPLFDPFRAALEERVPGLFARLVQVGTPRPGYQIAYRCKLIGRNRGVAFAERPATEEDVENKRAYANDQGEMVVRYASIETRGEGGYVIGVGSPARVHKNNRPYKFLNGDYERTPVITVGERDIIFEICESLSELPIAPESRADDETEIRRRERKPGDPLLPGDDYNARGDIKALLTKYGWTYCGDSRKGELWARPGKDASEGWSATLFPNGNLYVFSSSAHPLPQCDGHALTPFFIYTTYEHGGDFKAAAKALAKAGFGDPLDKKKAKSNPADGGTETDAASGQARTSGAGEIADLVLFDGAVTLKFKKAGRGKVSIEARSKDGALHQNTIDLASDEQRTRFLKKVAKKAKRSDEEVEAAEASLLKKAGEIEEAHEKEQKTAAKKVFDPADVYNPYEVRDGRLVWLKPITGSGEMDGLCQPITLTNFAAEITGDVIRDDGTEPIQVFEVEVNVIGNGGPHKGTVKAAEFSAMRWPVTIAGAKAVIYAGKVEHARAAVQLLSDNIEIRRVVAHTGWRTNGKEFRFYHGGGAIGASGLVQADVELPPALTPCVMPAPPTGERLREVVRAVAFDLPKVAPDRIALPLIGCVFVAVLTGGDFSLFLLGTTGKGKTELLILAQSFFGAGFDEKHIPANWGSTPYSIQGITHLAKDIICGVDDFVPKGTQIEQAKLHGKAETVLRGQANSSGRARCNPDGSVRPERPPRGLIISTGEDIPRGQSLVARLLATEVKEGSVDWAQLTLCQKQRREGVYAEATSAFLQWLATDDRIEKLRKESADKIHELRTEWAKTGLDVHKKVANTLAQIERAWGVWLKFAEECGAIDEDESTRIYGAVADALDAAGREQARFLANENPAARFIELLKAALNSGKAHIASTTNSVPDDPAIWGWRDTEAPTMNGPRTEWRPLGDRIGWTENDSVYLQPDAAYKMAQAMGANGEGLTISSQTLWKRLKEEGLLASVDEKRQTNKVRRAISDQMENVIHLWAKSFFPANDPG